MTRESSCVFCRIVHGELPAARVFDSDHICAFLDVGPLAEGHLLVIPRDHFPRLVDTPAEIVVAVAAEIPRLARAVMAVTGAAGCNVLCNNGAAAGQAVDHLHFHIIPRVEGDGLGYRWNAGKYSEGRAVSLAVEICGVLSQAPSARV